MTMEFTTIDQMPRLMGKRAATRLLERLRGAGEAPKTITTPVELIQRASTIGASAGFYDPMKEKEGRNEEFITSQIP